MHVAVDVGRVAREEVALNGVRGGGEDLGLWAGARPSAPMEAVERKYRGGDGSGSHFNPGVIRRSGGGQEWGNQSCVETSGKEQRFCCPEAEPWFWIRVHSLGSSPVLRPKALLDLSQLIPWEGVRHPHAELPWEVRTVAFTGSAVPTAVASGMTGYSWQQLCELSHPGV